MIPSTPRSHPNATSQFQIRLVYNNTSTLFASNWLQLYEIAVRQSYVPRLNSKDDGGSHPQHFAARETPLGLAAATKQ